MSSRPPIWLMALVGTAIPLYALVAITATPGSLQDGSLPEPIIIAFGGDVSFEGVVEQTLESDPDGFLSQLEPLLGSADLAVVNLQTAITTGGIAEPKDATYRAPPSVLDALSASGVDVVSLANDHALDYGASGFSDTLESIEESDLAAIGAGENRNAAFAPHTVTIRGVSIAIFGATQILDEDAVGTWVATGDQPGVAWAGTGERRRLVTAVANVADFFDVVIVYMHWGQPGANCPAGGQITTAERLIAAGADVVVGAHTGSIQANGRIGRSLVHFGMGSLVADITAPLATESGILRVTVYPDSELLDHEWLPATLSDGIATPYEPDDEEAARLDTVAAERRECAGLEP
jgi:poly-gamma-glutamate synthesis protein (capsule biosynthesis protein)